MITLLLGAGASAGAGYPVTSSLLKEWEKLQGDLSRVETALELLGIKDQQLKTKCKYYMASGLQKLRDSKCRTPDEFATRFPNDEANLAEIKKGLAALFMIYDGECSGDHFSEYNTLWANILSKQFAGDRGRTLDSILQRTPYRIVTYNYDIALLQSGMSYLKNEFGISDLPGFNRAIQLFPVQNPNPPGSGSLEKAAAAPR